MRRVFLTTRKGPNMDNKTRVSARAAAPAASGKRTPDLSRHQRHCLVCHHPERDGIEEAFVHWHNMDYIAHQHKVPPRSIYRHAHALGLFALRATNLRYALEHLIEKAETVTATADSVIRAIRAYTCLTDDGQWIEPPAHVVVSSGTAMLNPRPPACTEVALATERAPTNH